MVRRVQSLVLALTACGAAATLADVSASGGAVGRRFSFILDPATNTTLAFGKNKWGQLGIGSTDDTSIPTPVMFTDFPENMTARVAQASAGAFHALLLTDTGDAYATGWNRFGQFGDGQCCNAVSTPVKVGANVSAVAAGYGHSLLMMADGTVKAAGLNQVGQVGDNTTTSTDTFVQVWSGADPALHVVAGYDFSYILTRSGDVWAFGQNLGGQLGDGTNIARSEPVKVLISDVQWMSAGSVHGLFLLSNGDVYGTGANFIGQLGDGNDERALQPRKVYKATAPAVVAHVSSGGDGSCMIEWSEKVAGRMVCTGSNREGSLGLGDALSAKMPTEVFSHEAKSSYLGETHSLLVTELNEVRAAGSNADGELGGDEDAKTFGEPTLTTTATTTTMSSTTSTTTTYSETTTVTTVTRQAQGDQPSASGLSTETVVLIVAAGMIVLGGLIAVFASRSRAAAEPLEMSDTNTEMETARAQMSSERGQ